MDPATTKMLIIVMITIGAAFAAGFILIAVWAIRAGQFKDVEGVKYRMLEDFNAKPIKKDEFKDQS